MDMSRKFPGGFREVSRKCPGTVLDMSRKCYRTCPVKFGILDISSSQHMQLFMRNPNLRSNIANFLSQKGKLRKNEIRQLPGKFRLMNFLFSFFWGPGVYCRPGENNKKTFTESDGLELAPRLLLVVRHDGPQRPYS